MKNDARRTQIGLRRCTLRALQPLARLLLIAAWLVATIGFPVPNFSNRDFDTPFPCMDRPCGCRDARQCWTNCQCFSPAERVAWALARNVQIPDYAVLPSAAEMESIAAAHARDASEYCSAKKSCCCETGSGSTCCGNAKSNPKPATRMVLGVFAAKCKGLDSLWLQVAAAPLAETFAWMDCSRVELLGSAPFLNPPVRSDEPAVPPPRRLSFS